MLLATAACNFSTSQVQKVLRDRQFFNILTWKCASRHSGVQFFDIVTSKSGPKLTCFVHFHFETCFSPQRRAIFQHLNFKKCSEQCLLERVDALKRVVCEDYLMRAKRQQLILVYIYGSAKRIVDLKNAGPRKFTPTLDIVETPGSTFSKGDGGLQRSHAPFGATNAQQISRSMRHSNASNASITRFIQGLIWCTSCINFIFRIMQANFSPPFNRRHKAIFERGHPANH